MIWNLDVFLNEEWWVNYNIGPLYLECIIWMSPKYVCFAWQNWLDVNQTYEIVNSSREWDRYSNEILISMILPKNSLTSMK